MSNSPLAESDKRFFPLTEIGARIQQAVMPLVTIVDNEVIPLGTGFMISPDGLMMTAKHVIDEAIARKVRRLNDTGQYYDHCELYALFIDNERNPEHPMHLYGGFWPIDRCWASPELDIAYCWLRHALKADVPYRFPVLRLSPGLPSPDSNVTGFGYYQMRASAIPGKEHERALEYRQDTAFTKGKIIEVHPLRRDTGMLRFPCFHTDARFDHGMSGGPILNEMGSVCGVICSSFPPTDTDPQYISYGSLIWPALGTSIEGRLGTDEVVRPILVADLAHRHLISCDESLEFVTVVQNNDGSRTVALRSV